MTIEDIGVTFVALRSRLESYLRQQVHNPAVAEDLLQQVFVKALTALRSGRSVGNLTGWLYRVAKTTAIDYHRSNRPHKTVPDGDIPADDPEDQHLFLELASCLRPLAEALPKIYRDTLIATDFQGKSIRDVAAAAGLSVSAIKSRASRARALLKNRLLECCDVDLSNGSLVDYHRRTGAGCERKCL